jgi:hypothetical protein
MTVELAKAQVSAMDGVPPPSNFGLKYKLKDRGKTREATGVA